jgi:hypothetical protein
MRRAVLTSRGPPSIPAAEPGVFERAPINFLRELPVEFFEPGDVTPAAGALAKVDAGRGLRRL